jgi:hypothetical protein
MRILNEVQEGKWAGGARSIGHGAKGRTKSREHGAWSLEGLEAGGESSAALDLRREAGWEGVPKELFTTRPTGLETRRAQRLCNHS